MTVLSEIYNGWKNYVFPSPEVEEIAKKRIAVCVDCREFNKSKVCNLCGCYMPAKVRSIKSKCKLNLW